MPLINILIDIDRLCEAKEIQKNSPTPHIIQQFHEEGKLKPLFLLLLCGVETPVKKFTKATGQTVYRQIV